MKTINNINLSDIFGGSEPDVIPEVAAEADISDILKKKKKKKKY